MTIAFVAYAAVGNAEDFALEHGPLGIFNGRAPDGVEGTVV